MKKQAIARKESIILSAIEIIDELGLQGLSVRELAKKEGITDGALYRHFDSKEDIILAVLDYYSQDDAMITQTIEIKEMSAEQSMKFALGSLAEFYEKHPKVSAISSLYECFRHSGDTGEKIKDIIALRYNLINKLIKTGKSLGQFNQEVDSELVTDIILSSTREMLLKWKIDGYKFSLKSRVLSALEVVLKSCRV
jgi:AcrR family transcriptional regulator